jgi:hypothetical protein
MISVEKYFQIFFYLRKGGVPDMSGLGQPACPKVYKKFRRKVV